MRKLIMLVTILIIVLLYGCDSSNDKTNEKRKSIIAEPQIKAYDNAKSVEETLQDSEQQRRKAMQEQGI